ncbi:MAG: HlyC/CorC family transporter [Deltaproteobacteria bacterium HGW-Deltaproteobacteria-7]|jgi:CBS domain containing-hemolysin-like protein|nr:MAG: HlyC/CorC family transporter [Deltaproteobacteria bacterium HGW-Deltaproteobacteria-7]PKN20668.1 MAG: HlyC/CorC family transporter [Deltaproteobacteria bacterium HGW-Deltaproteobacteria-6]
MKKISNVFFWHKQEHIRREIFSILAKGQKSGVLDDASRKMIENILDFTSILVREIMIPRTDIVSISADDTPEEIIRELAKACYTRIPVHRGSIDNIIGILNVKDLLKSWSQNMTTVDILSHLTKPYYIPETKNAHLLFYEFKNNKKHIAIVIDEYGGTSGLITLEDLLEEIVGDIRDEHEENTDGEDIIQTVEGAIIVDGRTEIEKIEEYLNISLERGRYETISGLILNTIRRIPHQGEIFQIEGMNITIENADERTIKKVKIKKMDDDNLNEK